MQRCSVPKISEAACADAMSEKIFILSKPKSLFSSGVCQKPKKVSLITRGGGGAVERGVNYFFRFFSLNMHFFLIDFAAWENLTYSHLIVKILLRGFQSVYVVLHFFNIKSKVNDILELTDKIIIEPVARLVILNW